MPKANGWLIARPDGQNKTGKTVLYIEYTKRKEDNLPKRPNDGTVRATVASGWFDDVDFNSFATQPWYEYRLEIEKVIVMDPWKPKSCKYLFDGLQMCQSFDLLRLDTSLSNSFEGMFRGCSSVRELFDLDRFDTSQVMNTSYMFLNCLSLRAVSIAGWKTANIEKIDHMFDGCSTYVLADDNQGDFLSQIAKSGRSGIWRQTIQ